VRLVGGYYIGDFAKARMDALEVTGAFEAMYAAGIDAKVK
jgi:hypothetical protein